MDPGRVGGFGTQIGLFAEPRRRKRMHTDVRAATGGGAGASAADRVLLGGGLTASADETSPLLLGLGRLIVLGVLAARLFRRATT